MKHITENYKNLGIIIKKEILPINKANLKKFDEAFALYDEEIEKIHEITHHCLFKTIVLISIRQNANKGEIFLSVEVLIIVP